MIRILYMHACIFSVISHVPEEHTSLSLSSCSTFYYKNINLKSVLLLFLLLVVVVV